jgi:hypothetical protein
MSVSRRNFLKTAGVLAGSAWVRSAIAQGAPISAGQARATSPGEGAADYTIRITASPVEIAPKRIISTTTYSGQFPGPLLRFKEGQQVTVDLYNDTDTPEQLHWHGQTVPVDVDGAAEEGTPYIPAHGSGASGSCRNPQGIVSTTRTIEPAPTLLPASRADRSDICTSSPRTSRAAMTGSVSGLERVRP